jgi:hypothetical protein
MNAPAYIHLRLHSEFSVTDGIVRVSDKPKDNEAVYQAKKHQMPALGLSDPDDPIGNGKLGMQAKVNVGRSVHAGNSTTGSHWRDAGLRIVMTTFYRKRLSARGASC